MMEQFDKDNFEPINSAEWRWPENPNGWKITLFHGPHSGTTNKPRGAFPLELGRKVFLESTSEYECAMRFVTDWEHWKVIMNSAHMKKHIESWREEKELRDKNNAKALLWQSAQKGNVTAQKALYEYRQQEIKQEKQKQKQSAKELKEQEAQAQKDQMLMERLNIIDFETAKGQT